MYKVQRNVTEYTDTSLDATEQTYLDTFFPLDGALIQAHPQTQTNTNPPEGLDSGDAHSVLRTK